MAPSIEPLGKCPVSHGKLLGLRRSILMTTRRLSLAVAALFLVLTFRPLAQEQAVPTDLKPLLAAPQSEMRMVVQRYTLDRHDAVGQLRQRRRAGRPWRAWARRRCGRRAGTAAARCPLSPAPHRAAETIRHQLAGRRSARIDAAKLTAAAKSRSRHAEESAIAANLAQLDVETPDDGAGARGGAVRAEARAARRSAHPRRGHERAARRRHDHRRHEGNRQADGRRRRA